MGVDIIVELAETKGHKGDDIVEPLLGEDVAAAISRGKAELYERGTGGQFIDYTITYTPGLKLGDLIKVKDVLFDEIIYGKLTSITINGARDSVEGAFDVTMDITIRRATDFFSIGE